MEEDSVGNGGNGEKPISIAPQSEEILVGNGGKQAGLTPGSIDIMIETSFWRDILYEIINSMDPWDIDLSELATRYSSKVDSMKEMNFKIPANVVIVSAVLLRMKSQFMKFSGEAEFSADEFMEGAEFSDGFTDGVLPDGELFSGNGRNGDITDSLMISPKRVLKRRITAMELIAAIQEVLEDKAIKSKIAEQVVDRGLILRFNADITKLIEETYGRIIGILSGKDVVLFSELAKSREEMVYTLISILHLTNDQKLKIHQDKMFEEIYIRR